VHSQFEVGESLLRRAVDAAPGDVAAIMALIEHLHREKRTTEALELLDGLRGHSAKPTAAMSLRATILRDLGRQEEEVEILKKLAATLPRPESVRIRLGHAYRTLCRNADAVDAYRAVLAAAPFEGTSWWSLANLK